MLDELCAVIAARRAGGVLTVPLFFLLWKRVRHTALRAITLAARIASGAPPPVTRPRASPRPPRPPIPRLPREFAWIVKVVPGTAVYGAHLQQLLALPELAPLVADARFRRLVNPLCRMLGVPRLPPAPPLPQRQPAPDPMNVLRANGLGREADQGERSDGSAVGAADAPTSANRCLPKQEAINNTPTPLPATPVAA
jgi:hypothetical protein